MSEQDCPTCGPTTVEQHPRQPVTRCGNCKEWLTSVPPTQPPAAPETDEVVEVGAYAQQKEATARAVNDAARMAQIAARRTRELAAMTARAESAEAAHRALQAERDALRAGIWALGESIHGDEGVEHVEGCEGEPTCFACILADLRALLAGGDR